MSLWTVEEVAEFCEITVGQVYESRRRKEYPGVLGRQRGRRLLFPQDLVEAGPQEPEVTDDVNTAILWALQGIKKTLDAIHNELRAQRLAHGSFETVGLAIYPEGEEE
jgi:hypothetical protein